MARTRRHPFWEELKVVVSEAVLFGVKWLVVSLLILTGISWWLSDYQTVRNRSRNGQIAWERQEQAISRQAQPAPPIRPPQ